MEIPEGIQSTQTHLGFSLLAYCQLFQAEVGSLGGTNLDSLATEQHHVHMHGQLLAKTEPRLLTTPPQMNKNNPQGQQSSPEEALTCQGGSAHLPSTHTP